MPTAISAALVQSVRNPYFPDVERRNADRHICSLDATSRPLETTDALSFGAIVGNVSTGGLSITLCYPFKPGTFLSVDLQCADGMSRTLLVRVVHVHDQRDGQWRLGCEFLKSLTQSDVDVFI